MTAANAFALNFNFSSGQAFHQAPADNNSSARVIPISRPAAHDENTPEEASSKPSLWARAKAVSQNLVSSVKKDWKWMGASAGVGLAAKVLTAAVVVPNAALLAGAAAGVLAVNTVRYIKDRTAERSAIQEGSTPLYPRTWGKAAAEETGLYARHLLSKQFLARNLVGGTISAATFGLFSLGEAVSDTVQEAFFTPQASAPELPAAQTPLPEAPVSPVSEAPAPAITDHPDTNTVGPVEEADHLRTAKELINSSASASKAVQATYLRAEAGNTQAIKDLAYYFQNGKAGLPVDKGLARALFEQAALDGNKQALADLQWMEGHGAPLYNPATKIASGAANHVAAAGQVSAPSLPVTVAPQAVADVVPSPQSEVRFSPISEETRRAALTSVGEGSPQTETGLPAGRLAAECRPTVTSSANGHTSMLANCREFFNTMVRGDSVRHIAPNGTTGEFVYGGEGEVPTDTFRRRSLGAFIGEKFSHFLSPR
jgi:hypothetical protein